MKRNKIRYTSTPKPRVVIIISGDVWLQYQDDEQIAAPKKGDLMVHPKCEALHTTRLGEYDRTGASGYFKVDVYDGRQWCPVLVQELFPGNEHHFAKTECPIDTYHICLEMLRALKGRSLLRSYREHYSLEEEEDPAS